MEVVDRVCGMTLEAEKAAATVEHDGETYYFCCEGCKRSFEENPEQYLNADHGSSAGGGSHAHGPHHHH